MANIGSFKKSGNEFQGEIVTLSLQAKGVRIVPEANRTNDNAPSHRVYIGRVEVGAGCRSALLRAAIISRSSSTTRASTLRSTRTSSTTRTAKATPSSGREAARPTATESIGANAPLERSGGASCALRAPDPLFAERQWAGELFCVATFWD